MGTRPRRWISPFTGATHLTTWDFRRSGPGQVLRKDYTDSPHETNGSGDPGGSLRGRCHQVRARGAISGPARAAGCDSDGLGRSAVRTCYGRTAWTPHMKVMVRATQLAHSGPKTVQSGHLESIPSIPDYGPVTSTAEVHYYSAVRTCYGKTAWTPHMKVKVRATQLAHSGPKTVQSGRLESIPSLPDYGGVTLHGESTPLELHVRQ